MDLCFDFFFFFCFFSAYLSTTISTVASMIASFIASQHTFCFIQLQSEQETARMNHFFGGTDSSTTIGDAVDLTKDLIKRHDDQLNLKTPAARPHPHPSWVYRHNPASQIKRSISLLGVGVASPTSSNERTLGGMVFNSSKGTTNSTLDRVELLGSRKTSTTLHKGSWKSS